MSPFFSAEVRVPLVTLLASLLALGSLHASEWTAPKLAEAMGSAVEDGDATARIKMTSPQAGVLQVRIKSRRGADGAATVYEILWPNERKGEGFVLRQPRRGSPSGTSKSASGATSKLGAPDMSKTFFGSALAHADVIENFFRWEKQALAGAESVGKTDCVVLESQPGGKDVSIYGKVRSWIDPERMITMRVEKLDKSGRVVRRVETTQVAKDDTGRHVPAGMTVQAGGKTTEIDGSNIRHDVTHAESDFSW